MRRMLIIVTLVLLTASCAPVLSRGVMKESVKDIPLSQVRADPSAFSGRVFVLGGVIIETKLTEKWTQIEALQLPIDSYGYIKHKGVSGGRFIALYPASKGILDPVIFAKNREVTLAGVFRELRKGKIDEIEYTYPVFEIREIYLWEEREYYYAYPGYPWYGYPYWRYDPWYYDPWWYYPYPYWPPRRW